jgi:hypothetical protein
MASDRIIIRGAREHNLWQQREAACGKKLPAIM